jgi:hypothetical protein
MMPGFSVTFRISRMTEGFMRSARRARVQRGDMTQRKPQQQRIAQRIAKQGHAQRFALR